MNILYISHLDGGPWAGPTYSVPNQIKAQQKVDNILWYNLYKRTHPEWVSSEWVELPYYRDLVDFPNGNIADLPAPFNKPDLIVVEQFYCYAKTTIPRQLMNSDIPYIIVPRGELTAAAQNRKSLKKKIFNFFYYIKFARKATAIQYLTEQEKSDSGEKWNPQSLIIPNGVMLPHEWKKEFTKDGINAIVIGRIEPYQKGLDLLIEACSNCISEIKNAEMKIQIYGPDRVGRLAEMQKLVADKELDGIISFHEGIYGEEKERVLLNADVFIIPSRFEGHPTALIEALSYGLPALVTTGANMRSEIEEYNAGWGSDITASSIQSAIIKMIDERKTFETKGMNARRLSQNYSWSSLSKISHEKYTNVLSNIR